MSGEVKGKVWGTTLCIIRKPSFEVHLISIKKGTACSKHKHEFKNNMFFILEGELDIVVWKNDYDLVDTTRLYKGEMTTVPPQEYHRFVAETSDCVCLEIYWTPEISDDIVRETVGGLLSNLS